MEFLDISGVIKAKSNSTNREALENLKSRLRDMELLAGHAWCKISHTSVRTIKLEVHIEATVDDCVSREINASIHETIAICNSETKMIMEAFDEEDPWSNVVSLVS